MYVLSIYTFRLQWYAPPANGPGAPLAGPLRTLPPWPGQPAGRCCRCVRQAAGSQSFVGQKSCRMVPVVPRLDELCAVRSLLTTVLIIITLAPALVTKVGILVKYLVQYQRYVTELCENADQPQLACNGKCYLTRELKEASSTPASAPMRYFLSLKAIIFVQPAVVARSAWVASAEKPAGGTPALLHLSYPVPGHPPECPPFGACAA